MLKHPLIPILTLTAVIFSVMSARSAPTNGPLTVLASFPTGESPSAGLLQGTNGSFYGVAASGGAHQAGAIFEFTPNVGLSNWISFDGANGARPLAPLILGSDGNFYGTASGGGISNNGSVFNISPGGSLTVLAQFTGSNGANPQSALLEGTNGYYYGTTFNGGSNGFGCIFSLSPAGKLNRLYSFTGATDGAHPDAGLVPGTNGTFYGTTLYGGAYDLGSVFQLTSSNTLTTILSFTGNNGILPGALVENNSGAIYGVTIDGGSDYAGALFSLNGRSPRTVQFSFNVANGAYPNSPLLLGADGSLYGTTFEGGPEGFGTVFEINAANVFVNRATFDASNGNPQALLIETTNGYFYGTTSTGGANGAGAVYQLGLPPQIVTQPATVAFAANQTPRFSVSATGSQPLAYQWSFDGSIIASATNSSLTIPAEQLTNVGTYSVIVSNAYGTNASSDAFLSVSRPVIAIAAPRATVTNASLTIVGTASNLIGLSNVQWQVNGGNWIPAATTNQWLNWSTTNLILQPGTNVFQAQCFDLLGNASALAGVTVFYQVPSRLTLQTNGAGSIKAAFSLTNADIGRAYTVTALPGKGELFGNWTGAIAPTTNNPLTFIMVANMVLQANFIPGPPTIESPAANARTTNSLVAGTASGATQVTNILLWVTNLNTGMTLATNTVPNPTNWSLNIALAPGTNILTAQSIGTSNTASPVANRQFFFIRTALFALTKVGNGGVGTITGSASIPGNRPPTNDALLNIGEGYTLTATPGKNSWFTNWTSAAFTSNSPTLHFIMESGLSIQAHFVTNLFLGVAKPYNGLFYMETNAVTEQTAGMLSGLTVKSSGIYSGKLLLNGAPPYILTGSFNMSGYASNRVIRSAAKGGPVTVEMSLQWTDGVLNGQVSGTNAGGWTATLYAEAAGSWPNSAQYTVLFPPSTNVVGAVPPGDGYVLITNHQGNLTLSYSLADGTAFSQAAPVGEFEDVPLYASLYTNGGLILGWMSLSNGTPQAETPITWIKPATRTGLFLPGFTNLLSLEGSGWTNSALSLSVGTLIISNAAIDSSYAVSIISNTVVKEPGTLPTNSLTGTVNSKTGLLRVTFGTGVGNATLTGACAILQNSTSGGGYFVTKTNAGLIRLDP